MNCLWRICEKSVKHQWSANIGGVQRAVRIPMSNKVYWWTGQDPPLVTCLGQDTRPFDHHHRNPFFSPEPTDQARYERSSRKGEERLARTLNRMNAHVNRRLAPAFSYHNGQICRTHIQRQFREYNFILPCVTWRCGTKSLVLSVMLLQWFIK